MFVGRIQASNVIELPEPKLNEDGLATTTKSLTPSKLSTDGEFILQPELPFVGKVKLFNVPLSVGEAKSLHVVTVVEFVATVPLPSILNAFKCNRRFVLTMFPLEVQTLLVQV